MWGLLVFLVAVAGALASGEFAFSFPENARGNSRIVSGWEAYRGQIPHQLSLRMVSHQGQVFGCGASIIHSEWALTAAHCTANRPTLVLRAGAVNQTLPHLIFEALEYYNHYLYNEAIANIVQPHDIGLIKFPIKIEFNAYVQPIRIQRYAERNANYDQRQLVASGWGRLWTNGASPEHLNWVYLVGVSNEDCVKAYNGSSIIQASTVCTLGYNDTTQSTCQGDSGGPLTVLEEDGKPTVIGVASFVAAAGCHAGRPSGFIRPGFYHQWYTHITGINFDWDLSEPDSSEEESEEQSTQEPSSEEQDHPEESNNQAEPKANLESYEPGYFYY